MFNKSIIFLIILYTNIQIKSVEHSIPVIIESQEHENLLNSAEKRNMYSQDYVELTKSAAIGFLDKIELIAHEFGHAITAKILNGSPIDIHFGDIIKIGDTPLYLFKIGNMTFHGFNGNAKTFHRVYENESNKKIKLFLIKLMGPIFGIISLSIMKNFLNKLILKSNDSSWLNSYLKLLYFICNVRMLTEVLFGLTPINPTKSGDGYQIWKLLDSNEKYIGKIPFSYISRLHKIMEEFKLA